jgi:hypothetical protein
MMGGRRRAGGLVGLCCPGLGQGVGQGRRYVFLVGATVLGDKADQRPY